MSGNWCPAYSAVLGWPRAPANRYEYRPPGKHRWPASGRRSGSAPAPGSSSPPDRHGRRCCTAPDRYPGIHRSSPPETASGSVRPAALHPLMPVPAPTVAAGHRSSSRFSGHVPCDSAPRSSVRHAAASPDAHPAAPPASLAGLPSPPAPDAPAWPRAQDPGHRHPCRRRRAGHPASGDSWPSRTVRALPCRHRPPSHAAAATTGPGWWFSPCCH